MFGMNRREAMKAAVGVLAAASLPAVDSLAVQGSQDGFAFTRQIFTKDQFVTANEWRRRNSNARHGDERL